MRLNTVLLVAAIIAGLFGLGFVFLPAQVLNVYGVTTDAYGLWMARYFGVALLGIALLAWGTRGSHEVALRRSMAVMFAVTNAIGALVGLWNVLSPQGTTMIWSTVAIYALLALGFALSLGSIGKDGVTAA